MERKHFLTLGAGLTVGGLLGKSALQSETIDGKNQSLSNQKFDLENPFPVAPNDLIPSFLFLKFVENLQQK